MGVGSHLVSQHESPLEALSNKARNDNMEDHDPDHSPKWSHLNLTGGNGGNGGTPSQHLANNNSHHVQNFKSTNDHHNNSAMGAAAANSAAAAGYHPGHPHLGHAGQHSSTISSQFSALLGASSAGYLLTSESKTMPIF